MPMSSSPRSKFRRFVSISVILVLMAAMIVWYVNARFAEHRQLFDQDAAYFARAIEAQRSTLAMRVKDTAGFIASGMATEIDTKLRETTVRSPYLLSLGYFSLLDPGRPIAFIGKPVIFSEKNTTEYNDVLQYYQRKPGVVYTLTKNLFTALFPDLPLYSVVMAQSLPTQSGYDARVVVYAAIDMQGIVQDAAEKLKTSTLKSVRFDSPGYWYRVNHAAAGHWMDWLREPEEVTVPVSFGRGTTVTVTLRARTEPLASLFIMVIGLATLGATAFGLALAYQRMQRVSARRLKAALDQANKGNEAKSLFLANMSHEIRTPLNGVLGMAELLGRTALSTNQQLYVQQIKSSGSTLLAILNDILDVSKLEAGQLAIDPIPTHLPRLVTEVATFFASVANDKRVDIILDLDPNLPVEVNVDPGRLRQVLNNLISNAIKFTEKGEIVVAVDLETHAPDERRATVRFAIKDSGVGIADHSVAKLFSRFTQASNNTTRIYGGTGLGLAICKEICELMGGSIGVTSELGRGSTFSFALPLEVLKMSDPGEATGLRLALFSQSDGLTAAVARTVAYRGGSVENYNAEGGDLDSVAAAHRTRPFDAFVIDEARHIGAARMLRDRLRVNLKIASVPCIVLGRQQTNSVYQAFDLAMVKPFDGAALVNGILELLGRSPCRTGSRPSRSAPNTTQLPHYDGKRALLVDDNNVNLMFGSEILSQLGFAVATASDGAKAVDAVKAAEFDVVFMDCQMPVMDGYEATRQIRQLIASGKVRPTLIVAVTANALKGDRERCIDAGMDDFITKPIGISALESLLRTVFPNAKAAPRPDLTHAIAGPALEGASPPSASIIETSGPDMMPHDETLSVDPSALPVDAPVLDMKTFRATQGAMSNFDVLLEFYRTDTASYLAQIQAALATEQPDDAIMPAHTIKSSSRIVGAEAMASLAEIMEQQAKSAAPGEAQSLGTLFHQMKRTYTATLQRIDSTTSQIAAE